MREREFKESAGSSGFLGKPVYRFVAGDTEMTRNPGEGDSTARGVEVEKEVFDFEDS